MDFGGKDNRFLSCLLWRTGGKGCVLLLLYVFNRPEIRINKLQFMKSYLALIAVGLDAAATRFKSKIEKTTAAVAAAFVGIGLLAGSLSLLAEPVQTGPGNANTQNVCAPVVSYVEVTNDGSSGFRVSVSLSHGWDMFRWVPADGGGWKLKGYRFKTADAVRHFPLERRDFYADFTGTELETYDGFDQYVPVYFDYFARGGTGGKYFDMKIKPEHWELVHVRDKHYYPDDHWVNITLYITDRDPYSKTNARLPNGGYLMHCWVSDSDGNGYLTTVYLDNDGDGTFEQAF